MVIILAQNKAKMNQSNPTFALIQLGMYCALKPSRQATVILLNRLGDMHVVTTQSQKAVKI
jgi:hypothetical protein